MKKEKSFGNYDLYFDKDGMLLQSMHFEKEMPYKIIFCYDRKRILVKTVKLAQFKNELSEICDFIYDDQNRIITEKCRYIYYSYGGGESVSENIHTYTENKEEILMKSEDDDDCTFYLIYDEKHRVIEDKGIHNDGDLVWWNKYIYNEEGVLQKQISLNGNGDEEDGIYEYFTSNNGEKDGYKYTSKDSNYLREYTYEYNEKKAWVKQTMFTDGEPKIFYERAIEYYEK